MKTALPRFFLLLLLGFAAICPAKAGLQSGDLVAICGDSITAQRIYSAYMEEYLLMCQPEPNLMAMQFGWSGETSWVFLTRMTNDVLPFKASVATICYGMNDGGYTTFDPKTGEQYRTVMESVVKTFKDGGVRFIVVGTPGVVDTTSFKRPVTTSEVYNQTLEQLGVIAKEVAEKNGVAFADVHGPMMAIMAKAKEKYGPAYVLAGPDGVHPGDNGHLVMAYAYLKALGCNGEIGTITYDMKSQEAKATAGHKVLSAKDGTIAIESSKYPFCFDPDPTSVGARSLLELFPFNQDLNRFLLVVKNAPAGQYKVTWGTTSKEFSAEALNQGINLAAEFLDNPFSVPFKAVSALIGVQQFNETVVTTGPLHSLIWWRTNFPEEGDTYSRLTDKAVQKTGADRDAARKAVVPVTHSIIIQKI